VNPTALFVIVSRPVVADTEAEYVFTLAAIFIAAATAVPSAEAVAKLPLTDAVRVDPLPCLKDIVPFTIMNGVLVDELNW
jgi:hypothetical protein